MRFEKFEDIQAWLKSKSFALETYKLFKDSRDFSFKEQILRAAVSISNNIAEGFERQSNKEFRNFLYIAKGSSGECRSMIHLAKDLGYINEPDYNRLKANLTEISKMLSGLIKTL